MFELCLLIETSTYVNRLKIRYRKKVQKSFCGLGMWPAPQTPNPAGRQMPPYTRPLLAPSHSTSCSFLTTGTLEVQKKPHRQWVGHLGTRYGLIMRPRCKKKNSFNFIMQRLRRSRVEPRNSISWNTDDNGPANSRMLYWNKSTVSSINEEISMRNFMHNNTAHYWPASSSGSRPRPEITGPRPQNLAYF